MAQPQYADTSELQSLAITAAAATRFGSTAMTAQLQAASSIADSYLSSQFILPLQTSPQGWDMLLKLIVCKIAAANLYRQFGFMGAQAPADEAILEGEKWAMGQLDAIGKKTLTPNWVDSSGQAVDADHAGDFITSDEPVGFTERGTGVSMGSACWPWWS